MRNRSGHTGSGEQPGPGRRGHGAGRHRRRLPRLQRQQRPCPSSPPTTSRRGCPTPTRWSKATRCGSAASGSASSSRSSRSSSATAVSPPNSRSASTRTPNRCRSTRRSSIRPKSALGLKFLQIIARQLRRRASPAGDDDPAHRPTRRNRSTSTSSSTCSTNRPATRSGSNQAGFGNALAGRGPQLNEAFGALRRLVDSGQPVLRTIVAPSTNFAGFWRALEDLSATVAPVAETQASLFVALDRTFAAFARVSRPYIQETIEKGPADARRRQRRPAGAAALPPRLRTLLHGPEAGRPGACRNLADDRRSPARRRAGAQRLAGPQRPAAADRRSAARLPGRARRLQRPRPADRHQRTARAGDQVHRPGPDHLQLPDAHLPQPGQRSPATATASATGSTSSPSSRRPGRTARAAPPRRPPTARNAQTTCTTTRTPTPPPRASPLVRSRQRGLQAGSDRDRQRARKPGTTTTDRQIKGQGKANEPPSGARHQAGREQAPLQVAAQQRRDRDHLHPHLHDRPLPGLHRPRSVHQLRLRAERDLRQLGQRRPQLAGADRRRRSRPGDLDQPRRQRHHGHLHGRRRRAGRSTTTPSPRSARGSSSRATSSSNSTPAAPAHRTWAAAPRSRSATPPPRSSSTKS